MKSFLNDFKAFALRGNALDLAIGVVIGAAFNNIVTSLVTDIITPPLGLLMGDVDFSTLSFPLAGDVAITYGHFIQVLISFVITAFALFILIKAINSFVKKANEEPQPDATKSAELLVLEEIRDSLKK